MADEDTARLDDYRFQMGHDAGCDSEDLLDHCRGSGPHVRGCGAVDFVLGKK
jgi:hypothetical protein